MVSRGGPERAEAAAALCRDLLARSPLPPVEDIAALGKAFVQDSLSPGGCADLLAAAFFLRSWQSAL